MKQPNVDENDVTHLMLGYLCIATEPVSQPGEEGPNTGTLFLNASDREDVRLFRSGGAERAGNWKEEESTQEEDTVMAITGLVNIPEEYLENDPCWQQPILAALSIRERAPAIDLQVSFHLLWPRLVGEVLEVEAGKGV
ncbi:MAG: hypothetical protein ACREX4_15240 [Gammaproteobacteria bacterium]